MNFEPQKFFIGLMDFFSILLPGAVLTYLVGKEAGSFILGATRYKEINSTEAVAVFLVASYLLGHLLFLVGAWLDEVPYDWVRRRYTLNKQITRLAQRGTLPPWWLRLLVWTVFKQERDLAVGRAGKIKEQVLAGLGAKEAVNTFQWSKALLAKEHADSLATVQRFEADSKFFRSFVVVLFILFIYWTGQQHYSQAELALALTLPALWRYMDQRYKATNQAYWSVITLTAREGKVELKKKEAAKTAPTEPTHAGGVVFRIRAGRAEYLLVEAKRDPQQWVLPKGYIEESEHPRETAVREVHEETGVWARIHADMPRVYFSINQVTVSMDCHLMEYVGWGLKKDELRMHRWLSAEDAYKLASHTETRELLRLAQQRVERLVPLRKIVVWHKFIRLAKRARRIIKLIIKGPTPRFGE